ncbi:MAG TPA: selenocysteine-specific translation elongation factor [Quisquiliibacterium sp.]|nr:selenocysteine-specific translation elongation factor [Quisquiliibacterium sp.]
MIVATAGHVDHGKTSLIRALTGVDTDRLAEEKSRGMSIDLGFAYADLAPGLRAGFVDVPGHERFIRNMLAGVAAIDAALLVVAADDGPMPQTVEHLAVLGLLGVTRGLVALTKVDRVAPGRAAEATAEIRRLLADGPLRDAPVIPVVAPTGHGLDAVRAHLATLAAALPARSTAGGFRLCVDRAFSMPGAGTVVTGVVFSGCARTGDAVVVSPQGIETRIRTIRAHERPAEAAAAGQRCALNLAGVDLRDAGIGRGDWVVAPGAHAPTDRIDVTLTVLSGAPRGVGDGAQLQLHLGAACVPVRVALLGPRSIAPGGEGLAQLLLQQPIGALHGDRLILRDAAAHRTVAGGHVLDPFAPARGRGRPERLRALDALREREPERALTRLLELTPDGVELEPFERARNLDETGRAALRAAVAPRVVADGAGTRAISADHWQALEARLVAAVRTHHADHPDSVGPTETALAAALGQHRPGAALRTAVRALAAQGALVRDGLSLRLPEHRARLADADRVLLERITGILTGTGLRPPIVGELARSLDTDPPTLLAFLRRASALGHLVQVAPNRFYLPSGVEALAAVARALAAEAPDGSFDAAAYRDRSGIGRNLTIEVLEFLDRAGHTRFARNRRTMIDEAPLRAS